MIKKYIFLAIVAVSIIVYWWVQPSIVSCGGFAGKECPSFGYICDGAGNYPDAGIVCKKIFTR